MKTSRAARVAVTTATAVLLAAGAAAPASAAGATRRDVTAATCRAAGGHVEGSGYCVDASGEDAWGAEIDGQAVNPDPRPGFE
ncbi:hypothetical protein [Streptomyces sp. CBMA123]|uniref:hypothetical protein n=1 Tax=Streptomyces sp. CBMA123 TaxID=1896313 RepID=UPI001661FFAB|nr:hypothetical protein [Streptomyces sp. CBMA123]MBD0692271.1 hypothetical protein [Streptomyces sp. CBMA123]